MNSIQTRPIRRWIGPLILVAFLVIGWLTSSVWLPPMNGMVQRSITGFRSAASTEPHGEEEGDAHAGHDHEGHDHVGHDEATSLELSDQALRNIGLSRETIQPIELQTFQRSITVPALVVERPGRTRVQVATPMTGVITHVHAVQGEAVEPGSLLFQIRLTHEDLVSAQTDFLQTLGELDVEEREITRLQDVTSSGAVAGKVQLDREYARDKLAAHLRAQREALKLHGLSDEQVDLIASERRLLRELQIFAPSTDEHPENELKLAGKLVQPVSLQQSGDAPPSGSGDRESLILQDLLVHKGQSVNAGETLAVLVEYSELYIEGLAFEQDISQLRRASEQGWKVDAIFEEPGAGPRIVEDLEFAYLANRVDMDSRTLPFYVRLPNEITKDRRSDGNRYIEWKYLPGQRLQMRVPVEEMPNRIVLPVEAVAREGAEWYVFQQNGDHFDRVPVHVTYRDQYSAVIANDGSLFPGDVVAMRGAHQMQMALKNKAGGGVDPHAGHNH
ncbi:efflux RND transporter periplasmic adaptor subunit [Rubinisphaera margarita]|uniref:efflux RND transporter periplasmic adaptor subunit n=1 Tax=Rubinisphaera margarita TaxID=2909586 RepID=UPI001EE84589|nr:efflux RND transporter periplasmic adaptor subunit [Rubinisphaera margarita]MCG6154602.1 efflux RND transporter periplasmic adaptor subunit [Rubinisphaera margarita]